MLRANTDHRYIVVEDVVPGEVTVRLLIRRNKPSLDLVLLSLVFVAKMEIQHYRIGRVSPNELLSREHILIVFVDSSVLPRCGIMCTPRTAVAKVDDTEVRQRNDL